MTKSRGILPPKVFWTAEQVEILRARYPDEKTEDIARDIGRDIKTVYSKAHVLGLKKSAAFLDSSASGRTTGRQGIGTRFEKGITPWNKGTHFAAGGRSPETRFKPGHRGGKAADLYQPIGTERISKDGYVQRKINDDMPLQKRWRGVHILVWEEANGPLPAGHAIVFKDGNKQNTVLDNLECISRGDLMRRNTRHNLPKELSDLIQLRGAINRVINRRTKHEQ